MAGGTADDEKSAQATGAYGGSSQPAAPAGDHPREPTKSRELAGQPASEWTVSDRRGPLSAAVPRNAVSGEDVERFVPGSETDAVGAHDGPAPGPSKPVDGSPVTSFGGGEPLAPTSAPHEGSGTPNRTTAVDPEEPAASPAHDAYLDQEPTHVQDHAEPAATTAGAASTRAMDGPRPAGATGSAAPGRSFVPLALGVVIGALIGASSAALVYSHYAGSDADRVDVGRFAALSSRVDALDKRPDPQPALAALQSRFGDLATKVAALDKRTGAVAAAAPAANSSAPNTPPAGSAGASTAPSQPAGDPALGAKIAALQASLETLQKQSSASRELAGKLEALQAAVTGAQTLAVTARTNVDALKSQQQTLDGKIGALQSAVGSAQKQASAAQSGVDTVQSEQKTLAGKLGAPALAVVADSLVEQIASGRPFATQVDALVSLGADPSKVAVLRENAAGGVPSAQTLLAKFKPLADPIVATETKAPANAGFGERLKHGLFGLVSVRRADETTGTDLSSRVALIEADLAHNDVLGAYAVWTALPADAKQRSETWGAPAKTSVEAINAAHALQTDSIGSLAAKKS